MTGMVKTPVETTLATAAPDMVPNSAEPTIAACAGPPASRPVAAKAIFKQHLAGAGRLQHGAEHDVDEHDAADHLDRPAEDAVGGKPEVLGHARPVLAAAAELGRREDIDRRRDDDQQHRHAEEALGQIGDQREGDPGEDVLRPG